MRTFDPPMYVLKNHLKFVKEYEFIKHNLKFMLYTFKKMNCEYFKIDFETKNNAF